jgi:large subunit ribosomal protein L4
MSEVTIYNIAGDKTGSVDIEAASITEGVSPILLHRAVVSYEANQRQGSANTRTRGERSGSGKKLWRQKGTGRARMGSIRSPLWKGGGVTFGPKPRDYRMKLSKKERSIALDGALVGKLEDGEISAIDSVALTELKTKVVANFLNKTGFDKRVLFVTESYAEGFLRASGNISNVKVLPLKDLNALTVLTANVVIFEKAALDKWIAVEAVK